MWEGNDAFPIQKDFPEMAKVKKVRKNPWDADNTPYGTYDTSNGFGNECEWAKTFEEVWASQDACFKTLKEKTPFDVLGVALTAGWEEIKIAFRELVKIHHPDRGGNEERCKEILAAWTILKERFGK